MSTDSWYGVRAAARQRNPHRIFVHKAKHICHVTCRKMRCAPHSTVSTPVPAVFHNEVLVASGPVVRHGQPSSTHIALHPTPRDATTRHQVAGDSTPVHRPAHAHSQRNSELAPHKVHHPAGYTTYNPVAHRRLPKPHNSHAIGISHIRSEPVAPVRRTRPQIPSLIELRLQLTHCLLRLFQLGPLLRIRFLQRV